MRIVLAALAVVGALAAASCATLFPENHAHLVAQFCQADQGGWVRSDPPADAQAFRDTLSADQDYQSATRDPEYWFQRGDQVRLCHTPLQRAGSVRHDWCSSKIAAWWDFRRTESGLSHPSGDAWVCLT